MEEDIGNLLIRYNDICNIEPLFSCHRLNETDPGDMQAIVPHYVAGMLGVYGNITGSTCLHGLVGILITGSENACNVIGDDAGMVTDNEEIGIEDVKAAVRVLGEIEDKKFGLWIEDEDGTEKSLGWHYVKRPITVSTHIVKQDWMPDFPIIARIVDQRDGQHTSPNESFLERRRLLIKQTCRLFESMRLHISQVTDDDIDIVLSFLENLFRHMHLPVNGSFPVRFRRKTSGLYPDEVLCIPSLVSESIKKGWYETLRDSYVGTGFIRVPMEAPEILSLPEDLTVGLTFRYAGFDKVLNHVVAIGFVVKEMEYEDLLLTDEVADRLFDFLMKTRKQSSVYTVIEAYPQWMSYTCRINGT
jgi:hypothetical protein